MKYRLKVTLAFPAYMCKEPILKGEIFEVFMVKEVRDKIIVYCKTEDENWDMHLETLQLFAEEYYEPQERKTCPTCKHQKECMARTKESCIFLLGDFCARYEKATTENIYLSERDKKEVCWKCRRFNDKSMNICQNYEDGVKCRIWFDDNGNRIDGVGRNCLQEPDKPAQESESAEHL